MFILTAHLKGYTRENIKVEMTEDKARILVSGKKSVQETVMEGSKVYKQGIAMREFRKAFKIPNEVISDQIKARFNEDDQDLTISVPKKVKGIRGISVEEADKEEVDKRTSKTLQITTYGVEKMEEEEIEPPKIVEDKEEKPSGKVIPRGEKDMEMGGKESERQDNTRGIIKPKEEKNGKELNQIEASREKKFEDKDQAVRGKEELPERENENENERESALRNLDEETCEGETKKKCKKLCVPVMVGSVFFVSVIVLVIHLLREKNPQRKKKH
ncbi:uncharacterized protein LOC130757955 [Actinidia eriantha]|uniref:uncharacterized protein LOC130757955 n=1 Tax=Actinidia eriantha TaxID=165200 RepID=UPI0025864759|nr:uncharacterized protein LOC130757955 [Actinidia eriantha]